MEIFSYSDKLLENWNCLSHIFNETTSLPLPLFNGCDIFLTVRVNDLSLPLSRCHILWDHTFIEWWWWCLRKVLELETSSIPLFNGLETTSVHQKKCLLPLSWDRFLLPNRLWIQWWKMESVETGRSFRLN